MRRGRPHPHYPSSGGVLLGPDESGVEGARPSSDVPVPSSRPDVTCGVTDTITGAVCTKPGSELHVAHRCVDDGIEFTWKDEPSVLVYGDLAELPT